MIQRSFIFRNLAILFFSLAVHSFAHGQLSYAPNSLTDGNGNPLATKKASVPEATYLFNTNYMYAVLYPVSGKPIYGNKFKLNLRNNALIFKDSTGNEVEVSSPVKRVEFLPAPGKEGSIIFEKGFPAIEKQTPDNYYEVIVSGKASLLMDTKFDEVEYKEYNSATTTHRTDKLQFYYGVMGNAIARITRPDDLLLLFADKTKMISDYIKKENIKVKKQADLEKVFQYYNSLN